MTTQPPPVPQVQVLPWLAQPLTPLLWVALGAGLLLALVSILRFRRSSVPCPASPRWLAVATVISVGYFAGLSLGGQLANPITLYAAPLFILVSTLVAWGAWHAAEDSTGGTPDGRTAGVTTAALACGAALASAALLACAALLKAAPRDIRLDLDLGLGTGEAVSQLLPALGTPLLPLLLIPASHKRSAAVRRALAVFTGTLWLLVGSTVAAAGVAMTTPLPYESPLSDRYVFLNVLVSVPIMLGIVCVLAGAAAMQTRGRAARTLILLLPVPAAFFTAQTVAGVPMLHAAFGFDWWRPAAALAGGVVVGSALGALPSVNTTLRIVLPLVAIVTCGVLGDNLAAGAASPLMPVMLKFLAGTGLFITITSSAHTGVPDDSAARTRTGPIAGTLIAACLLVAGTHLVTLCLRSELTYQARRFSSTFDYESNRQVDPEMRSMLRDGQHAVHIAARRWAWVLPQSTWWTRDGAWRDGLLLIDKSQPHADLVVPAGHLYAGVITGADRVRSDQSFTDAQYVALIQPVPIGQKSAILHTVAARLVSPAQLQQWLRITPTNPRAWFAGALALPVAWWLSRAGRSVTKAVVALGAVSLGLALLTGVGGVVVFSATAGVVAFLLAARRDDDWRSTTALAATYAVVLALLALAIPLGDIL